MTKASFSLFDFRPASGRLLRFPFATLLALFVFVGLGAQAQSIPVWSGASQIKGNITGQPVKAKFGLTQWGKALDPQNVLPEYPRPQLVRPDWLNLNGSWDYAFAPRMAPQPAQFGGKILVPFPIESALSGVQLRFGGEDRIWYHRTVEIPAKWSGQRIWLRFGAVDWETEVFVNGKSLGKHQGGYDPFSFDITDALTPNGAQDLVVAVWDPTEIGQPHGKQKLNPGPIEYTPCSGIWQTVWLEPVPKGGIDTIKMTPDIDHEKLTLSVAAQGGNTIEAVVKDGGAEVARATGPANAPLEINIPHPKLWWPDTPFLYDVEISLKQGDQVTDKVTSYFGMRKISVGPDSGGVTRILLNNQFILNNGVLDQGYWPDGIYTAPSDDALRSDIEMTKKMGFNMSRKHLKVEPARWYYWTDKLGLLVWQDMPAADGLQAKHDVPNIPNMVDQYELELRRMIATHYNNPSIVTWVLFNEGLGIKAQMPMSAASRAIVTRMVNATRQEDPTRLIDHESGAAGWEQQGKNVWDIGLGDIIDFHCYGTQKVPVPTPQRASVVGEYGYEIFPKVAPKYAPLVESPGVSGLVYTQLTDVENEKNGLLTYDRQPKPSQMPDDVLKVNQDLFGKWETPK
jgi:hypothetical protein